MITGKLTSQKGTNGRLRTRTTYKLTVNCLKNDQGQVVNGIYIVFSQINGSQVRG